MDKFMLSELLYYYEESPVYMKREDCDKLATYLCENMVTDGPKDCCINHVFEYRKQVKKAMIKCYSEIFGGGI